MLKTVVKTFKFPAETTRRLRAAAGRRKMAEAEIVRAGLEKELGAESIDMAAALGADFGCVATGDTRPASKRLADFGR
jgi:hypothetical protein